ncbi:MAG: zinc ribbon domain-containing protein [Burkholderiales bacterium]
MFAPETIETSGFKQCRVCGAEQLDRDKFCRRCGVNQSGQSRRVEPLNNITGSVTSDVIGRADRVDYETRPLSGGGTLRRSYSGPLVGIVTLELSEQTSSLRTNRWARLLISTLVAVPLWLMIVLLSPLDAYVAAKEIAKQV